MEAFLTEHGDTIILACVGVVGLVLLGGAAALCFLFEEWFAGFVFSALGLLLLALPVGTYLDEVHRQQVEASRIQQQETACSQAPTTLDNDESYHIYAGTVVPPPSSLGGAGVMRPYTGSVIVSVDGTTTDFALRNKEIVVQGRADRVEPGNRLAFCGHVIEPVHWWPQIGYQDGKGAVYGEPVGPYPAVRWVMDTGPYPAVR